MGSVTDHPDLFDSLDDLPGDLPGESLAFGSFLRNSTHQFGRHADKVSPAEAAPSRYIDPNIPLARDAAPSSANLQSRQLTYDELAAEFAALSPDASPESIAAQVEAEVLAQRIRCITVYESPFSTQTSVRYLKQATTLPLFNSLEISAMPEPKLPAVATSPDSLSEVAQHARALMASLSKLDNPLAAAAQLQSIFGASGDFRLISKMESKDRWGEAMPEGGKRLPRMLVLDVETTGMDYRKHKVIELGLTLIEFSSVKGEFGRVIDRYNGFEDPGEPLTEEITKLTGITDEMVTGQHFDDERVAKLISMADLVVAHNAGFDRPFAETRFQDLKKKWWACTFKEGPWDALMTGSAKLEYLCYKVGGFFYEAHRALTDVEATIRLMSTQTEVGTVLSNLLANVKKPTYTIWATNSPFDTKDKLKEAGYRWSPEEIKETGELKAWFKEGLTEAQKDEEIAFLGSLYKGSCVIDRLNGATRYAKWIVPENREKVELPARRAAPSL